MFYHKNYKNKQIIFMEAEEERYAAPRAQPNECHAGVPQ